jgi:hypothetical protein
MATINIAVTVNTLSTEATIWPVNAAKTNNQGQDLIAHDRVAWQIINRGVHPLTWIVQSSPSNLQGSIILGINPLAQGEWQNENESILMPGEVQSYKIHDNMKRYWRVIARAVTTTSCYIRGIAKDSSAVGSVEQGETT